MSIIKREVDIFKFTEWAAMHYNILGDKGIWTSKDLTLKQELNKRNWLTTEQLLIKYKTQQ